MTDPTTPATLVHIDPSALLDHPSNVRDDLGDLNEGSGFHQMRATRRVLIRR